MLCGCTTHFIHRQGRPLRCAQPPTVSAAPPRPRSTLVLTPVLPEGLVDADTRKVVWSKLSPCHTPQLVMWCLLAYVRSPVGQPGPEEASAWGRPLRLSRLWRWARPRAGCWGSGHEGDTALPSTSSLSAQGRSRSRPVVPEGSVGSGGPCSPSPEVPEAGWAPAGSHRCVAEVAEGIAGCGCRGACGSDVPSSG